ncbi:MAG: AMP-binding protein [Nitrospirae bacterium]|nr:AMP-binding protein [Nitrospirota bacterium]
MPSVASLESRLLDMIERADPTRFDLLALEVFAYQYAKNRPYRLFCDRRGLKPDQITDWRRIPAVPTSAFKVADLTCSPERPSTVFLTSGTTQGTERRGRHLIADLAPAHAAIVASAQAHLFPDLPLSSGRRLLILSLTPPPSQRQNSSLIHMIDLFMQRWGAPDSRYLGQSDGLDGTVLTAALDRAVAEGQPVALIGTTAAFVRWFEQSAARGWRITLPFGSRLMDTGGRKGIDGLQTVSLDAIDHRELFLATCERFLGLPAHAVINEYGMTELSCQFYMGARAEALPRPPMPPYPKPIGLYTIPPWVRVRVIDPATGDDVPPGQPGLLCHYDPANLHSVMAVQTDDLGMKPPGVIDGFHLLGRVAGAELRGCSLDASASLLPLPASA